MRKQTYLDESILLILASSEKSKKKLILLLEKNQDQNYFLIASTIALWEVYRYFFANYDARELRKFISEIQSFLGKIIVVKQEDFIKAIDFKELYPISVKTALHAAVMYNRNIEIIVSYEEEFDLIGNLSRLDPYKSIDE